MSDAGSSAAVPAQVLVEEVDIGEVSTKYYLDLCRILIESHYLILLAHDR